MIFFQNYSQIFLNRKFVCLTRIQDSSKNDSLLKKLSKEKVAYAIAQEKFIRMALFAERFSFAQLDLIEKET